MAEKRHDWFLNQIFHHRAALHRYLGKLTSGAEDIEDLVQETYVRIYALPDYLQVESPKALLFRIAHNLAVERARRFESFCAAVERLPPLCRRVFVLRKVHKLSHAEISEVLGVSQSTIEKHVAKGLVRCRDYMRELGLLEVVETKARSRSLRSVADGGSGE
jgi:RNA polymerase sigma-70 factor (ECF subfamily)